MKDQRALLEQLLDAPLSANRFLGFPKVVLYGAGNCGRRTALELSRRGITVAAFLDAKPGMGGMIDGIPCFPPESDEAERLAREGLPVILTVFNYAVDPAPIRTLLQRLGFTAVISYYEAHEFLGLVDEFWLGSREWLRSQKREILSAFDLLVDSRSREVFHDHVALRLAYDEGSLAAPDLADQYAPSGIPFRQPIRLVDGGGFDGDTLRFFAGGGYAIEGFASFEPDLDNFAKLAAEARSRREAIRDLILMPAGLGRRTEILRFQSGDGAASKFSEDGNMIIPIVALDQVLPNFSPTLIKLDIEGAESDALQGAELLIRESTPDLAICIYHRPADLWEIPQLMQSLLPEFKIRVRCHRYHGFDLVAYATRE